MRQPPDHWAGMPIAEPQRAQHVWKVALGLLHEALLAEPIPRYLRGLIAIHVNFRVEILKNVIGQFLRYRFKERL